MNGTFRSRASGVESKEAALEVAEVGSRTVGWTVGRRPFHESRFRRLRLPTRGGWRSIATEPRTGTARQTNRQSLRTSRFLEGGGPGRTIPVTSEPGAVFYGLQRRAALALKAAARARQRWTEDPEVRFTFPEGPASMMEQVVRVWQSEEQDLVSRAKRASSLHQERSRLRAELDALDERSSQVGDLAKLWLEAQAEGVRLSPREIFEILGAWRSE